MNFDQVEWQPCDGCGAALQHEFWTLGDKKMCAACRQGIQTNHTPSAQSFWRALLLGVGGAVAGGVLYWFVRVQFHVEIGILAIGVGYLVGHGVRWGAGQRTSQGLQILALVLTYLAITLQFTPDLAGQLGLEGVGEWLAATPRLLSYAVAAPFAGGMRGIIGAIIMAVALREAWRLTAPISAAIKGPFAVGR